MAGVDGCVDAVSGLVHQHFVPGVQSVYPHQPTRVYVSIHGRMRGNLDRFDNIQNSLGLA